MPRGLSKNTIVIYTSDQGFFLGDHGFFDKRFMYEESLRMPFLVRYPGAIKAGVGEQGHGAEPRFRRDVSRLRRRQGSRTTCRAAASVRMLEGHTPKDWRTSMYYRYWMHMADHGVPAHYGVRTKQYKLIYYYGKALGSAGRDRQGDRAGVGVVRPGRRIRTR